jgi:hypothetical protein
MKISMWQLKNEYHQLTYQTDNAFSNCTCNVGDPHHG